MNNRLKVLDQISAIEDGYCKVCDISSTKRGTYCIDNCKHGQAIRELGKKLEGVTKEKEPIEVAKGEELTKERYLELNEDKRSDKEIKIAFGIKDWVFYEMKKDWGLIIKRKPRKVHL